MVDALSAGNPRQNVRFFVRAFRRNEHQHRFAHGFLRRVAKKLLCAGIPTGDDSTESLADDRIVGLLDDGREPLAHFLHPLPFGDITHDAGEDAALAQPGLAHRQVQRKGGSVFSTPAHLAAAPDDFALTRPLVVGEVGIVLVVIGRRHEHVDVVSHNLVAGIAEDARRGRVHRADDAPFVDSDDAVDGRFDHGAQKALALAQGFLGPLALGELTYLAADRRHHLDQVLVGLLDFAAEELDDAGDFVAAANRKTERRVQTLLHGERRAWEVALFHHIGDPDGAAAGPNADRQADPGSKGGPAGDGFERRNRS